MSNLLNIVKLFRALKFALSGLCNLLKERAFLQELILLFILFPLAYNHAKSTNDFLLMFISGFIIIIAEALNTSIESVVDRFGKEEHELAKKAKDIGAAAVLLSVILAVIVWVTCLFLKENNPVY